MLLWAFAVAGSALVLTQSSITAPLREWLIRKGPPVVLGFTKEELSFLERGGELRPSPAPGIGARFAKLFSKLVSCPMCSGFWFGLVWSYALGDRGVSFAAHGFGGSVVSAIAVALWLLLVEATSALAQWRWQSQKEDK